jgi:Flp pilus assembly secretin CpaC
LHAAKNSRTRKRDSIATGLPSRLVNLFTIRAETGWKSIQVPGPAMPLLRKILVLAIALAAAAPVASLAANNEPITVKASMARILRISAPAATVIIGNPGVADVTIQDPQTLVLTGKSYGETNLIILDSAGNPIADTMVSVIQATPDAITMYMGTARTTLSCLPVCQSTVTLGDDSNFSNTALASSTLVQGAATSK